MYLTLVPQCVVSEGIAMVAHEMIFSEGEAERWIAEQMNRLFQKEVDATALLRLRHASEMLEGAWCNAAMLLDEGRSDAEVAQYFVKYMLLPEDRASSYVALLKHPLYSLHFVLTYGSGQKLVRRWLQGIDRVAVFRRFLTEQWTPSQLAADALPDYRYFVDTGISSLVEETSAFFSRLMSPVVVCFEQRGNFDSSLVNKVPLQRRAKRLSFI